MKHASERLNGLSKSRLIFFPVGEVCQIISYSKRDLIGGSVPG